MSAKHCFIAFFVFALGCSRGPSPQQQSAAAFVQPEAPGSQPEAPPPVPSPAAQPDVAAAGSVAAPEVQAAKPSHDIIIPRGTAVRVRLAETVDSTTK